MSNPSLKSYPQGDMPEDPRRMLEGAVEASPNGVVLSDPNLPDMPIIYVNPAFERMTGYSADEVLGRNCRFLQGDDRDQPDLRELRSAISEARGCRVTLKNYRKDGSSFWNELYMAPVYGPDGKLASYVGIQNDVTGRQEAQEALRRSEELLRLATEAGGIGIVRFGLEGDEVSCYGSCVEIFELEPGTEDSTREELLGKAHPEDREPLSRAWGLALSDGTPYELEHRLVRRNGGVRWVSQKGRVYQDGEGGIQQVIGTVQDITSLKESEEEKSRSLEREQRIRAEAERARRRTEIMASASRSLSSSLDYDETLSTITGLFVPDIADWCLLHLLENNVWIPVTGAHADPEKKLLVEELGDHMPNSEDGLLAEVIRTGRPALHQNTEDSGPEELSYDTARAALLRSLEPCWCMGVPLKAAGKIIGVLTLVSSSPENSYGPEDLSMATRLADRCALALENARLYREQSYVARTLQRGLLPHKLPEIPGVEVGVEYLPAGEDNEVGGDFYDLIDTNYDGWLCILGDVSGKGARAAAVTALIMYTLRAVAFQGDKPSAMFAALNEAMVRHDTSSQFCTAVCARLEPEEGDGGEIKLTLARAGHPPPLLLRDGSVEEISEPGKAIGVFPELDLEDHHTNLVPGDVLLFYTDGVIEARSATGEFFGEERLKSFLKSCTSSDAASIARRLRESVLEHKGDAGDDVAILAMRVTG